MSLLYAPNKDWADQLISQCCVFPKGRRDDMVDSMTQALRYLRDAGLAQNDEEVRDEENDRVRHQSRPRKSLYPV
jgi:hypothetical protein